MEIALTGDLVNAVEAEEMNIINYFVSSNQIEDVARELARSATRAAPSSVKAINEV